MPAWLVSSLSNEPPPGFGRLLLRVFCAFLLGLLVGWIYRWTHLDANRDEAAAPLESFVTTLVLMTILIAVSTQVIGDNVARAFSLVGALSIVRFRTVVKDTRDIAFVIFAVVIGMAVGAGHLHVALTGLVVTGLAAFVARPRPSATENSLSRYELTLRLAPGRNPDALLAESFAGYVTSYHLTASATARQGIALDVTYQVQFAPQISPLNFTQELSQQEGIMSVALNAVGGA